MSRRGFALLAVLWVLTAVTAAAGAGLLVVRLGTATTRNRVLLARAEWAREACGEILLARFGHDPGVRLVDSVDLGRGTWCRADIEDPAAKLNLNTADREALVKLLSAVGGQPSIADSILALRGRGTIADLTQVPGVDSALAARLTPSVTTRGTGAVNVNAAPRDVLATLPGLTDEGVWVLLGRRDAGRPVQSADELAGALSRSSRTVLLESYPEFVRSAVFAAPQLVAHVDGGVRGTGLVARATLTMVPVAGHLAVVRRETE